MKYPKVPREAKRKAKKYRKMLEKEDKELLSREELAKGNKEFVKRGFKLKDLLSKLKNKKRKKRK